MKRILLSLLFVAVAVAIQAQDAAGVLSLARRVNDYFVAQNPDPTQPTFVKKKRTSNLWTRAVYYEASYGPLLRRSR